MEDPKETLQLEQLLEEKSEEEKNEEIQGRIEEFLTSEVNEEHIALFNYLHPADRASILNSLPPEVQDKVLASLSIEDISRILEQMYADDAARITQRIPPQLIPKVLDEVSPDVAADILRQLPIEVSAEALGAMVGSTGVISLLKYPDESAGGIMVSNFVAVRASATAAAALDGLRILGPKAEDVRELFAVDRDGKLVGSLSVATLALAKPKSLIQNIMNPEVVSIIAESDQEACARLMEKYDLTQLPVVDQELHLLGVILLEDVVDILQEEATEDMYKMAGLGDERALGPITASIRTRLPWLTVNLATAFLAASVVAVFQSTIAKAAVLATFLPIVAGQGGIGGTQTLTLVVRGLALGEISLHRAPRLLLKESALGIVHGVAMGVIVSAITLIWHGNPTLGLIVGLAMLGNMMVAGLTGASIPLILKRMGLDPAVSSAIFVTTFTDCMGFFFLLGLATLLIHFLS